MKKRNIHLICNAHLDPVWLWEWEEGAAAVISTFRTAADLCEEYDNFIFNHNEVILYKWVEEYEPALFTRIQKLVKEGKWHIMGGWYLQPDCNMPSGESFVRQILTGRQYFKNKFNVTPKTAINFDPFGHTRGLVQIMAKSGYDSYLFCRPGNEFIQLPAESFIWSGYDGSTVIGHRSLSHYNTQLGEAGQKVSKWLTEFKDVDPGIILWGVGNHGGGPSRIDLDDLKKIIETENNENIIHSIPEKYFKELSEKKDKLPVHDKDINPWAVGCYTSQSRIKHKHRLLENELYMTEKMVSTASYQGLMKYPDKELNEAIFDLLEGEFHDILPGSSIQPVEETSLRVLDHGLEIVSRIKARAFFALAGGQAKAEEGEIPILVYNPHPYKVKQVIECETQLAVENRGTSFTLFSVYNNGKLVPSQIEQELSNLPFDWRKRVIFEAELEPSQMNRFDCKLNIVEKKPEIELLEKDGKITFETNDLKVVINTTTGFIDEYIVGSVDYISSDAFKPIVMNDDDDPWGMMVKSFRDYLGSFKLMSPKKAAKFAGLAKDELTPVQVIEDGPVRSVVEALFEFDDSFICQRYKLPKKGTQIQIETRVVWNQKSKMLKLSIPTQLKNGKYFGQVAYGKDELPSNGNEAVAQKWVAVSDGKSALSCINNGIYGSDYADGEIRLSLLRSPAFSGHPFEKRPIVPQNQYSPRIDQGERLFHFWLDAGDAVNHLQNIDSRANEVNEKPFALSFFPCGLGNECKPGIELSNPSIQMTTLKKAESSNDLILRLFEPTGKKQETNVNVPFLDYEFKIDLNPFEIKTVKINPETKQYVLVDLMEQENKDV